MMGSDARIEEIRVTNRVHKGDIAWLLRDGADNDTDAGILHRHILLEEVDRLSARVVKMTTTAAAHVEERDRLRWELESAESIAWDYEAGQVIQLEEIDNLKAEIVDIREQLAEAQGYAYSGNVMRQFDTAIKSERQRCVGIIDEVINNPAYKHCLLTLSGILDSIEKLTP